MSKKRGSGASLFSRIFTFALGLVLLPLVLVGFYSFLRTLARVREWDNSILFFLGGIILFFILDKLTPLKRVYILSHELSHALFSVSFGGKVQELKVKKNKGWVKLTLQNFLVKLAPYFFPLISFFISLIYFLLLVISAQFRRFYPIYILLLGFSLTIHFWGNWQAIRLGQSDIEKTGKFFSFIFISGANLLALLFFLKLIFWKNLSLTFFLKDFIFHLQKLLAYVTMFKI